MCVLIQFLHPEFLYGLLLLAIPIILHLFSLKRYKKVYFSNFNFLEALQQQKKNSSKLKNLLLLFLRLILISCMVIAFASPYINRAHRPADTAGKSQVVIYADNSFSMTNTGSQGSLFEEAKKHLFDIVNSYPNGTGFRLLTNDAVNDLVLTKEQMHNALGQLKVSPASKPLSLVMKEAGELTRQKAATLFMVSDFQQKNCDFPNIVVDSTMELVLLLLKPENLSNVYISDVGFEQAFHQKNRNDKIRITVANASQREFHNIPVTLTINDKKKSISQIDIPANGKKELEISYLNSDDGFYKGTVEISDFPVVFDNKFYFSYSINSNAEVLYIWQDRPNPYFGKLFSDSTVFSFTSLPVNQTANLNISKYNLVITDGLTNSSSGLESILEEYLMNGGNLFMLPSGQSTTAHNRFLQKLQAPQYGTADTNTTISHIETQAALFRDVFAQEDKQAVLPHIERFYHLNPAGTIEKLLQDKRNNVLLASKTFGKGNLYVSAFSFDAENSDMVYHPLFIPLMANMACRVNSALNTSYFLNTDKPVTISNINYTDNLPLQIRREDLTFEFIPEIRKDFSGDLILTNSQNIQDAGIYEVVQDNRVIDMLAWNYERPESDMQFSNEEELQKQLPQARVENIKTTRLDHNSELIKEIVLQDNNKYLTPWFLLLAVIALLLEQWVWRRKLN